MIADSQLTPEETHPALADITIDPYWTASYDAAVDAYTRLGLADHAQTLREEMAKRLAELRRIERQHMPA